MSTTKHWVNAIGAIITSNESVLPSEIYQGIAHNHPVSVRYLGKEKSTEKIDGAVASVMALDRAIRCGNDAAESVYDSRGLLFI